GRPGRRARSGRRRAPARVAAGRRFDGQGMNLLHTIVAFVIALGVLVLVHEYGHYLVARLIGIKVIRFSIGFGPSLWKKRFGRDQTEWVLAAVPLGGYVRMLDEREGEVAPEELGRAVNRQNV